MSKSTNFKRLLGLQYRIPYARFRLWLPVECLQLFLLDNNTEIEPMDVYTWEVAAPKSVRAISSKHPHWQCVSAVIGETESLDPLLDYEMPEAHWIAEQPSRLSSTTRDAQDTGVDTVWSFGQT